MKSARARLEIDPALDPHGVNATGIPATPTARSSSVKPPARQLDGPPGRASSVDRRRASSPPTIR